MTRTTCPQGWETTPAQRALWRAYGRLELARMKLRVHGRVLGPDLERVRLRARVERAERLVAGRLAVEEAEREARS